MRHLGEVKGLEVGNQYDQWEALKGTDRTVGAYGEEYSG